MAFAQVGADAREQVKLVSLSTLRNAARQRAPSRVPGHATQRIAPRSVLGHEQRQAASRVLGDAPQPNAARRVLGRVGWG